MDTTHVHELGEILPLWSTLPFAALLAAIALGPLLAPRFWHHHYPKVALVLALALAVPFLLAYHGAAAHAILHTAAVDYIPFILLLWGLFTVAGGIVLRGTLTATPAINTGFLAFGGLIASAMGTTGASMLLIRPVLRANAWRPHQSHVIIFFIFIVANIGGLLTPLGDPPLFLGFLRGLSFFWSLRLFPIMIFVAALVLSVFYLLDRRYYRRDRDRLAAHRAAAPPPEPLGLAGTHNFLFLAGIVGAVLLSGTWHAGSLTLLGVEVERSSLVRDGLILIMGLLSLATTPATLRRANGFTWAPIREVAILFAGIFTTIIPALAILKAGSHGPLAPLIRNVADPSHYFWATGILSSFLDNAPTYLTFLTSLLGRFYAGVPEAIAIDQLGAVQAIYLEAVAAGAVFMGANTYIGNAPNFMIKSIAEEAGVAMPSFIGYMAWSGAILIPIFILTTWIFF